MDCSTSGIGQSLPAGAFMDGNDPISRRQMLRSKLGPGVIRSLGRALGQATGVARNLTEIVREPPPPPPPAPEIAVFLRPPCAIEEIAFAAQCTKCSACIDACPPKTLVPLTGVFGKAFNTPVIDPARGGCTMCEDLPCVKACVELGTGVLDARLSVKMGHAVIHHSACRSTIDDECRLCIDACPVPGVFSQDAALVPVVDTAACTGCGLCVSACPVDPVAVSIIPLRDRPPKPVPDDQPDHDQNGHGPAPD
jgi:ferredoxin-type protein NapG